MKSLLLMPALLLIALFSSAISAEALPKCTSGYEARKQFLDMFNNCLELAKSGDGESQYTVGHFYMRGNAIGRALQDVEFSTDFEKAMYWFDQAIENDILDAYSDKGYLLQGYYEYSPIDYEKALEYYSYAAERDHGRSQWRLSGTYKRGKGVAIDTEKTLYWLKRAAKNKFPNSFGALGSTYKEGIEVPKDEVEAYKWYFLGTKNQCATCSKSLRELEDTLSSGDIEKGRELAESWLTSQ